MPFFVSTVLLLLASLPAAHAQDLPLRAYFFPYASLFEAKVYQYVNEDNPNDIVYQFTQTHVHEGDTLLTLQNYDRYFQELETKVQHIHPTGVYLQQYSLYIAGRGISSRVIQEDVYKWESHDSMSFKWAVRYSSPYGEESFRKMRQVLHQAQPRSFQQKKYPTIQFRDDFRHSVKHHQGATTNDFFQYSYYAKGLGLIAYDRTLASGKKLRYRLTKIMDLNSWKALQNRPQQPLIPIKRT